MAVLFKLFLNERISLQILIHVSLTAIFDTMVSTDRCLTSLAGRKLGWNRRWESLLQNVPFPSVSEQNSYFEDSRSLFKVSLKQKFPKAAFEMLSGP